MMDSTSLTTADAVSVPPAPGPSSMIWRTMLLSSSTALSAPPTDARGWSPGTSAGSTRTDTAPSTRRAMPSSFITNPSSWAMSTSSLCRASMPEYGTSSISTRVWKAMDDRIAILAAASPPPTSSVGSASA